VEGGRSRLALLASLGLWDLGPLGRSRNGGFRISGNRPSKNSQHCILRLQVPTMIVMHDALTPPTQYSQSQFDHVIESFPEPCEQLMLIGQSATIRRCDEERQGSNETEILISAFNESVLEGSLDPFRLPVGVENAASHCVAPSVPDCSKRVAASTDSLLRDAILFVPSSKTSPVDVSICHSGVRSDFEELVAELGRLAIVGKIKSPDFADNLDNLLGAIKNYLGVRYQVGQALSIFRRDWPKGQKGVWTPALTVIAECMGLSINTMYRFIDEPNPINQERRARMSESSGCDSSACGDGFIPATTLFGQALAKRARELLPRPPDP
jgi:hypothetical protein